MSKAIFLIALFLFASANCSSNTFLSVGDANSNVLALIDGLFSVVGLPASTTIGPLLDETLSQNLLTLIGTILSQASNISAVSQIESEISAFVATVPNATLVALASDSEVQQAVADFGLANLTEAQIQSKAESYVLFHLSTYLKAVKQGNADFTAGNYNQAGIDAGNLIKPIFTSAPPEFATLGDANSNVLALIDGLFSVVGLPASTTIGPLLDETLSQNLLTLIGTILTQASNISAVSQIESEISAFVATVPNATLVALASDSEVQQAVADFGLTNLTEAQIQSKAETYVLFHLSTYLKAVKQANADFTAGNYNQAGVDAGNLLKPIFASASSEFAVLEDANAELAEVFDGAFEAVSLPDPTTIAPCFDATTSQNLITLIGTVLSQASSGSISEITQIESEVKAFASSIPSAVSTCLSGNAEISSLLTAYNLTGKTAAQIEKQAEAYVIGHFLSVLAAIEADNTAFTSGNFDLVGQDSGKLLDAIVG